VRIGFFDFRRHFSGRHWFAHVPESQGKPAQIVVRAYTQNGCLEELQQEAKNRGVEVKLTNVESDLGWEILVFPFYKGYKCTGEVTGSAKSTP
jgi:hypothetical protein